MANEGFYKQRLSFPACFYALYNSPFTLNYAFVAQPKSDCMQEEKSGMDKKKNQIRFLAVPVL
jgi:hypothetical protein